jgi:hypothetical protein
MPLSKHITSIISKKSLTKEEWYELIRYRCSCLRDYLDSFTLPQLGKLSCLNSATHTSHNLMDDDPQFISPPGLTLKTQGIFSLPVDIEPSLKRLWCFSRDCHWLLIEVKFENSGIYQKATRVRIQNSDLSTIITRMNIEPITIWNKLSQTVNLWKITHEHPYLTASKLAQLMSTENEIISIVLQN